MLSGKFDYGGSASLKYGHNGPFNEPVSFGIAGFICNAKVTKLGTNVGINMLINIIADF